MLAQSDSTGRVLFRSVELIESNNRIERNAGDCYVFVAVAAIESIIALTWGTTPLPLSKQQARFLSGLRGNTSQCMAHSSSLRFRAAAPRVCDCACLLLGKQ